MRRVGPNIRLTRSRTSCNDSAWPAMRTRRSWISPPVPASSRGRSSTPASRRSRSNQSPTCAPLWRNALRTSTIYDGSAEAMPLEDASTRRLSPRRRSTGSTDRPRSREIHRVLKPTGAARSGVEPRPRRRLGQGDLGRDRHPSRRHAERVVLQVAGRVRRPTAGSRPLLSAAFRHDNDTDRQALVARVMSISFIAAGSQEDRDALNPTHPQGVRRRGPARPVRAPVQLLRALVSTRLTPVQRRLLDWASAHGRDLPWRRTRDPWAVLVSEVMLQQTQVARVVPVWTAFLDAVPHASRVRRGAARRCRHRVGGHGLQPPRRQSPSGRVRDRRAPRRVASRTTSTNSSRFPASVPTPPAPCWCSRSNNASEWSTSTPPESMLVSPAAR